MTTPTAAGSRYRCEECGTEILIVKTGEGTALACCGKPVSARETS